MQKTLIKLVTRNKSEKTTSLLKQGLTPASYYNRKKQLYILKIDSNELNRIYRDFGERGVVYLQIDQQKEGLPAMIAEVQFHPLSNKIIHVSFRGVDLKERIRANIPVELVGEFKLAEAFADLVKKEIEVEALPTDLPESFTIEASSLKEIGAEVLVRDLKIDTNKIAVVGGEDVLAETVLVVSPVREEEGREEKSVVDEVSDEKQTTNAN